MKPESLPSRSHSRELIEFTHALKLESLPPDTVSGITRAVRRTEQLASVRELSELLGAST